MNDICGLVERVQKGDGMAYNHLLAYRAELTLRDSVRHLTPLAWAERKYMGDEKGCVAVAALLREYKV